MLLQTYNMRISTSGSSNDGRSDGYDQWHRRYSLWKIVLSNWVPYTSEQLHERKHTYWQAVNQNQMSNQMRAQELDWKALKILQKVHKNHQLPYIPLHWQHFYIFTKQNNCINTEQRTNLNLMYKQLQAQHLHLATLMMLLMYNYMQAQYLHLASSTMLHEVHMNLSCQKNFIHPILIAHWP